MSQISSLLQSLSLNLPQSTLYRIHQAKYDHENYASENSLICELQTVFAKNENFEPNRQAALIEAVSKLKNLPIANRAGLVYFLRCLSEKNLKGDKLKKMNNSGNNNNSGNKMSSFGDFNSTTGTNNSATNNTQIHVPGLQLGTSSSMQRLNFSDTSSQVFKPRMNSTSLKNNSSLPRSMSMNPQMYQNAQIHQNSSHNTQNAQNTGNSRLNPDSMQSTIQSQTLPRNTAHSTNSNSLPHSASLSQLHNQLRFQSTPLMGNSQQYTSQPGLHNLQNTQSSTIHHNSASGDSKNFPHSILPVLSEPVLYDQVLYAMRGVETEFIHRNKSEDSYRLASSANADSRHIVLVHNLCEAGWFHDKILSYQESAQRQRARFGKTGQALAYQISHELNDYYTCLAQLSQNDNAKSLVQLTTHTSTILTRLKYLAIIVENCGNRKGSTLLSTIFEFTKLGDPLVVKLSKSLLQHSIQPFLQCLQVWLIEGKLTDNYQEFFVEPGQALEANRAEYFWREAYRLLNDQIPTFLSDELSYKILKTGKSVAFLTNICKEKTNLGVKKKMGELKFQEIVPEMVHKCYFKASRQLLACLYDKYELDMHFQVMRLYLLLGQGDFIRHLLDLLAEELDKDARLVYGNNLKKILEDALRVSSITSDVKSATDRLEVRLLDHHPGEKGWDIFSLDYFVEDSSPLKAIFTPGGTQRTYLRLFGFLWRAKRMEYMVSKNWTELRYQTKMARRELNEAYGLLHNCHLVLAEMMHYTTEIQYYVTFEVLECNWAEFKEKLTGVVDFDELVATHKEFLEKLVRACLLAKDNKTIFGKMRSTFDRIQQFSEILKNIFSQCEIERQRRTEFQKNSEWEMTNEEQQTRLEFRKLIDNQLIPKVAVQKNAWTALIKNFLTDLIAQPTGSLRSLAWRLDFSRYYKIT